jgi:hypothetical protein
MKIAASFAKFIPATATYIYAIHPSEASTVILIPGGHWCSKMWAVMVWGWQHMVCTGQCFYAFVATVFHNILYNQYMVL